jgi:hypothetical protein
LFLPAAHRAAALQAQNIARSAQPQSKCLQATMQK